MNDGDIPRGSHDPDSRREFWQLDEVEAVLARMNEAAIKMGSE